MTSDVDKFKDASKTNGFCLECEVCGNEIWGSFENKSELFDRYDLHQARCKDIDCPKHQGGFNIGTA